MPLVNQLLHCKNATKMQCDATIVEFDPKSSTDAELISKLQLENPNSYGWLCAAAKSGSRIQRHHSDGTLRLLQEIEDLKPGTSPYFAGARPNERIYKIDVAGETYEILERNLKRYAQAIDVSRYFLYRFSDDCDKIEFYAEKKELTPKQHAFHSAYYDTVYTEHFLPTISYRAKRLALFHGGEEFEQQNDKIPMICWVEGCKAELDKSYRDGQIVVNFKSNDDTFAHSHSSAKNPLSAAAQF